MPAHQLQASPPPRPPSTHTQCTLLLFLILVFLTLSSVYSLLPLSPSFLPCNSHWHTHLSSWLYWLLLSYLGPCASIHTTQPKDYPCLDLLPSHSLIGKCPERKGAFGCSHAPPSPLSPFSNRFFKKRFIEFSKNCENANEFLIAPLLHEQAPSLWGVSCED